MLPLVPPQMLKICQVWKPPVRVFTLLSILSRYLANPLHQTAPSKLLTEPTWSQAAQLLLSLPRVQPRSHLYPCPPACMHHP